jgi:hypothetical protein
VTVPVDWLLARLDEHEPSDRCAGMHCYSHHVDEPGGGVLACAECSHLYRRWGDLRRAHRASLWRAARGELRRFLGDAWHPSWWRFLWHLFTVRAGGIYSCPYCAADF